MHPPPHLHPAPSEFFSSLPHLNSVVVGHLFGIF
jgi:hypothetical protein